VRGWLHVEADHLLLPPLAALARAAERVVAAEAAGVEAGERGSASALEVRVAEPHVPARAFGDGADEVLARAADTLVAQLGLALGRRGWTFYDVAGAAGEPRLAYVRFGGAAVGGRRAGDAPHSLARRALQSGVAVVRPEPDGKRSAVRSELALPLRAGARVLGVLSVASERARDLDERAAKRLGARLEALVPAWRAARFQSWHRVHFGADVTVDLRARAWARLADAQASLPDLRAPIAVVGPSGAGKEVLVRWLLFERDPGPPRLVRCEPGEPPGRAVEGLRAGDALLLDGFDAWDDASAGAVEALLTMLPRRGVRVLATLCAWPRTAVGARARTAARLGRYALRVPPLHERRDELPGLLDALLAEAARQEERAAPVLADGARALLWRQSYADNLRGLEAVALALVAHHAGAVVGVEPVRALLEQRGAALVERLPSRHPRRADVEAALRVTRKKSGAWNKTRAALYLGWDPDTLARRMRELGIG